jgi:hypothetical protein
MEDEYSNNLSTTLLASASRASLRFCSWVSSLAKAFRIFSAADPDPGSGAFLTPGSGQTPTLHTFFLANYLYFYQ